jgi:cytoskeletal protein CcmA (bactofilin family)
MLLRRRKEERMFRKPKGLEGAGREVEWTRGNPVEPRVVAPAPVLRPSLGRDTAVSGRLSFTVPTRIDGRLRGEVRASELLVVGEEAIIEGTVRALKLVVLGEVRGEVRGAEHVEIAPTGRLMGTVETQSLVVREGGCLDGDCRIAPARTPLRILRPEPAARTF